MDTQSFLMLVKPQGQLVTKSSSNCLKMSYLFNLLPTKALQILLLQSEVVSNTRKHLAAKPP